MKRFLYIKLILAATLFCCTLVQESTANIYIIYYATYQGKTGHIGVAISKYQILVSETKGLSGKVTVSYDTVMLPQLIYFDLWPARDYFNFRNTNSNLPAKYFKLPVSTNEEITLKSLYYDGIPHEENYPCDGILKIETTWEQDRLFEKILDSLIDYNRPFNAQKFNCSDFVRIALEVLFDTSIKAKEFIGKGWSTTPNKLYKEIKKLPATSERKDPGNKVNGSFLDQRVIYNLFKAK